MPKALCCETIKSRRRCLITFHITIVLLLVVTITVLYSLKIATFENTRIVIVFFLGYSLSWPCTKRLFRNFKIKFLNRAFPVWCGHAKCIFTGKSSRTLKDILLTINKELYSEEEFQRAEETAFGFLNDVKAQLERITGLSLKCAVVGSVKERFGIPPKCYTKSKISSLVSALQTDLDAMFYPESTFASFSGAEDTCVKHFDLGHALLVSRKTGATISSKEVKKQVQEAIDSTKVTNLPGICCCCCQLASDIIIQMPKGPAIKVMIPLGNNINQKVYEADIIMSIRCSQWPPMSDWPRRRRCWPNRDVVGRITLQGCYLVPKPAPSDKNQTSWRFSFSLAEAELSKSIPITAQKCFLALKIILKDHLKPVAPEIKTYHLKTIFFNTLEETPSNLWVDENIEKCFLILLRNVHDALMFGDCPHYWFSHINMFREFPNPKRIHSVVMKLKRIIENPAPFIFDDGCCCIYPCCVRRHLYDFPVENFDRFVHKRRPILKQPSLSNEVVTRTQYEPAIVTIQPNDTDEEHQPILDQDSLYQEIAPPLPKPVIVTVHSNEVNGEGQPILNQPSYSSNYGACS